MARERIKIEDRLRKLLPDAPDSIIREILELFEDGEPDVQSESETPPGTPPPSGPPGGGNG